jgi:hypothetical protein
MLAVAKLSSQQRACDVNSRDSKRYDALRRIGCIACVIDGQECYCGVVEIHHLVTNGYRRLSGGNQATIPLGRFHHQGIPFMDRTVTWMRNMYGPSMALESKAFAERYGNQRTLLARVNEMLSGGKRL